jgi:hypothetical protein
MVIMKNKIILILIITLLSLSTIAFGELLDYDTFNRDDNSSLGITEGNGNVYYDVDPVGSIGQAEISNNSLYINLSPSVYEYYQFTANFSDTPVSEFTAYFKIKSSINTEYLEMGVQELAGTNVENGFVVSNYGSYPGFYEVGGQNVNSTINSDEWVEFWLYKNDATDVVNVTFVKGNITKTSSIVSTRNDFGRMYLYFEAAYDATGDNQTILYMDEWAVCTGYNLSCVAPEPIVVPEEPAQSSSSGGSVAWPEPETKIVLTPPVEKRSTLFSIAGFNVKMPEFIQNFIDFLKSGWNSEAN